MIAAALRAEIERQAARLHEGGLLWAIDRGTLERARDRARALGDLPLAEHYDNALVEDDLAPAADATEGWPSSRALVALVDRATMEDPAACVVSRALCAHLAAELGPAGLARAARCGPLEDDAGERGAWALREDAEATLDAIDALVPDPRRLPGLRDALRSFAEQICRVSEELAHARAPRSDLRAAAS